MTDLLTPATPTVRDLQEVVFLEARLLDDGRLDEWNALYTEDAIYWLPLVPGQPDGIDHTSHLYEDALLRRLRIERLKSPRAYSQHPPSRCHHLLQTPHVEAFDAGAAQWETRTSFHYTESRGDALFFLVGTAIHRLVLIDGRLRIAAKRVNLLNSDAALPSVQLFI